MLMTSSECLLCSYKECQLTEQQAVTHNDTTEQKTNLKKHTVHTLANSVFHSSSWRSLGEAGVRFEAFSTGGIPEAPIIYTLNGKICSKIKCKYVHQF